MSLLESYDKNKKKHLLKEVTATGATGAFVGGSAVISIAIVHLIASMVYGAGGLLHSLLFVGDMQDSQVLQARKFKLEWDNPDNQTFILGHH